MHKKIPGTCYLYLKSETNALSWRGQICRIVMKYVNEENFTGRLPDAAGTASMHILLANVKLSE